MVTKHSIERLYQRTKCNKKSATRIIENGIRKGKSASECTGRERRYLGRDFSDVEYVFHNGVIFVVTSDEVCLTVWAAPKWFGRKTIYSGKTRIRNPRKAYSYNLIREDESVRGAC